MMNLLAKLQQLRRRRAGRTRDLPSSPEMAVEMARRLAQTRPQEYSCADVYQLLDQFAEAQLRGENVAHLMPLVHQHLEMCRDCRQEYEALLRILEAESTLSPT